MSVTATSRVATERGERYRKQLASHFGNKIEVVEEPAGTVLRWGFGGSMMLDSAESAPHDRRAYDRDQARRRRREQQPFGHSALVDRVAGGERGADLVGQGDRQESLL